MKKLIIITALTLCVSTAFAATLNVNPSTGNDANTYAQVAAGTHEWATLGRAAWGSTTRSSPNTSQAAQAGDTVLVSAGTYNASSASGDKWVPSFQSANSGTAGNLITFRASGSVTLQSTNGQGPVIGSSSRNYIVWDGFYIDEANVLTDPDTGPVTVLGATGVQLLNLEIKGKNVTWGDNHNGIRVEQSNYVTVGNCKIYDISEGGTYGMNSAGIMAYDTGYSTFENNEIYNCGSGIWLKGYHGVNLQTNNIIRKNLIYNIGDFGIGLSIAAESRVYQNVVRDSGSGVDLWNVSSNTTHQNNTIVNNTFARTTSNFGAISFRSPGDMFYGDRVYNNIFHTSTVTAYGTWSFTAAPTPITFEHNVYYNTNSNVWKPDGVAGTGLAAWKVLGYDSVSPSAISSDPLFTNLSGNVFTLQGGSPAAALGVDILDLDGDSSTSDNIPAGAYITGSEVIGIDSGGGDLTPPTVSSPLPNGAQAYSSNPQNATLQVTTNENATCRMMSSDDGGSASTPYSSMTDTFTTTGTTAHSEVKSLAAGASYSYWVQCIDPSGNDTETATQISFSIDAPPVVRRTYGSGTLPSLH